MSAPGSSASRAATKAANAAWHASIRSTAASASSTPSPSHATRRTASRERSARVARRRGMLDNFAHGVDAPAHDPRGSAHPRALRQQPALDGVVVAGRERGGVAAQPRDQGGDLLWLAEAIELVQRGARGPRRLRDVALDEAGLDEAG